MIQRTKWMATLCFVAVLVTGMVVSYNSFNGYVYIDLGDSRQPAAIPRRHDLTRFEGYELSKKIHERLIGDAHILLREGAVGLELGQFVTESPMSRDKKLACSVYNRIEMVFVADGMAVSGELPKMTVSGDCEVARENVNWIKPIWIPYADIKTKPTTLKILDYADDEPVSLSFENMTDTWPDRWVLESMRMYNKDDEKQKVEVSHAQVHEASPNSIILEW